MTNLSCNLKRKEEDQQKISSASTAAEKTPQKKKLESKLRVFNVFTEINSVWSQSSSL